MKAKKSLIKQFTVRIMLLVAVIIVCLSAISISFIRNSTEKALRTTMEETSALIATKLGDEVIALDTLAKSILSQFRLTKAEEPAQLQAYMKQFKEQYALRSLDVLDENFRSIVTGAVTDDTAILTQAGGKTYLGDPVILGDGEIYFPFVCPVNDYFVVMQIPYTRFETIISSVQLGESGSTYVINKAGLTVLHKSKQVVLDKEDTVALYQAGDKQLKNLAAMEENMAKGETGFGYYSYNKVNKFGSYDPIPNTEGWSVNVTGAEKEFMSAVTTSIYLIIGASLIFFALSAFVTIMSMRRITRPLQSISTAIERIYEGDLSVDLAIKREDEIGLMSKQLNGMVEIFRTLIHDISRVLGAISNKDLTVSTNSDYPGEFDTINVSLKTIVQDLNDVMNQFDLAAGQVRLGAEQVSAGAQGLAQGTTEQASSVQELAATVSDLAQQLNHNAEHSKQASEMAQQATVAISSSNEQMQQLMRAMTEIDAQSKEIGKIIKTIEDIAFQTNILALNAAVEAARAGVAGKGFAVVADEVRNLAAKSAEAAKNTTTLIEGSIRSVSEGVRLARSTADELVQVVVGANETTDLILQITKATNEQSLALAQITTGLDQISAVVQTNSATSEQSAASSQELSAQAQVLTARIEEFHLDGRQNQSYAYGSGAAAAGKAYQDDPYSVSRY